MDPSSDQQSSMGDAAGPSPTQAPAINLPPPTVATAPPATATMAAVPTDSGPTSQNPLQAAAIPTTQPVASPVLNDSDKVERAWVDKARQIVNHTQGNPYQQSQQLTALKAEYMKQRYNKIIKVEQ